MQVVWIARYIGPFWAAEHLTYWTYSILCNFPFGNCSALGWVFIATYRFRILMMPNPHKKWTLPRLACKHSKLTCYVQLIRFLTLLVAKFLFTRKKDKIKQITKLCFFCNSFFCVTYVTHMKNFFFVSKKVFFCATVCNLLCYFNCTNQKKMLFALKKLNAKFGVTQNRKFKAFYLLFNFSLVFL